MRRRSTRAGLTERTFFRYFADKREVLFWGAAALQELLTSEVARAPRAAAPMAVVVATFEATAPMFAERRAFARRRHDLIAAHAELRERELIKLASLASAMAEALRRRGVKEPAASLSAEAGIAIFKVGFERWLHDPKQRDLARHFREALRALKSVTAER